MLGADAPGLGLYFVDNHFVPYAGAKPVAVPDALADEISLAGPAARIRERLQVWESEPGDDAHRRHARSRGVAITRGRGPLVAPVRQRVHSGRLLRPRRLV